MDTSSFTHRTQHSQHNPMLIPLQQLLTEALSMKGFDTQLFVRQFTIEINITIFSRQMALDNDALAP